MVPTEIVTPDKVRKLQRTLYQQAKRNAKWRAWSLYGDLCRRDVLELAAEQVVSNKGSAGIDGVKAEDIKSKATRKIFLDKLQEELEAKRYQPSPVRRVEIPKGNGKTRQLGIPTVADRVVQAALRLLLEAIFEADMHPLSFGYRPKKSAHQAIDAINTALLEGRYEIIDADLSNYFDTIPHDGLLTCLKKRVSDGSILALVSAFLKAPVEVNGTLMPNEQGTPQGGVISPLLANLYLNGLDHQVNGEAGGGARMIRYADDLVIVCHRGQGRRILWRLKRYLEFKGLTLNEDKTRLVDFNREGFVFLGFQFHRRKSVCSGKWYIHIEPSRKAQQKLRDAVRKELNHWTRWQAATVAVAKVNRIVRGWVNYFYYGQCARVFNRLKLWLFLRYRNWLWQKHKRKLSKSKYFTYARVHGLYRLYLIPTVPPRFKSR